MKNITLQNILKEFSDECEILILHHDYEKPARVNVEYNESDNFNLPQIIIEI